MLYLGIGLVLVLAIVMGIWLKQIAPRVGIMYLIFVSMTILLIVIATLIRAKQPDFRF